MLRVRTIAACWSVVGFLLFSLPATTFGYDFGPLHTLIRTAVKDSVFPGASIAVVYRDQVVLQEAFGRMTYDSWSRPVDTQTLYDLASLTKAVCTTSITMQLAERDSLSLQAPVTRYLPEFAANGKEKVTIENLMRHLSGLRAHTSFAKTCRTPEDVLRAIGADTLVCPPNTATIYSDLGFITLGKIIEAITGRSLASNFSERFSMPLGMNSTMFNPPQSLANRIAPVEKDRNWPLASPRPLVHDQNAALLGGAAGHAGLFSTTEDLVRFVRMIMNGGKLDGKTYIRESTLKQFFSHPEGIRALGWDVRSPGGNSSAGILFSTASYGHLGYTGTSIWIDPTKNLAVIFLCNRVYPTSENIRIRRFRPVLHDTVVKCLGIR
ncbi:MAG: beta-lactamase family protein [Chlorobiaceae bacterium]|nr:beta-lactamase family protein [Chlorobiaceae bacterium]NTV59820.1 beta-lactamase family protein [Chlorobiaceae bacterium]